MRRVLGVLLMVDGLAAALWFTTLLASLSGREALSVAVIVARAGAGALAVIGGWLITQRRPPGEQLAIAAAVATSALVTIGAIWRLLPTNLDPSFRMPVVGVYWGVTLVIVVFGVRAQRRMRDGVHE